MFNLDQVEKQGKARHMERKEAHNLGIEQNGQPRNPKAPAKPVLPRPCCTFVHPPRF
jgi:putative heme iron utilization protein